MGNIILFDGGFDQPNKIHETKIWRYMGFSKFLNIIDTSSLFFPQACQFNDNYEGWASKTDLLALEEKAKKLHGDQFNTKNKVVLPVTKILKELTVLNCWHINDYESAAMWKLYVQSGDGIAIQSTIGDLCESINVNDLEHDVTVGRVRYVDYDKHAVSEEFDDLALFSHKRPSFSHENELRAAIQLFKSNYKEEVTSHDASNIVRPNGGVNVSVDLKQLINKIFVAPSSSDWTTSLIKNLLSKYDLSNIPINKSEIYSKVVK